MEPPGPELAQTMELAMLVLEPLVRMPPPVAATVAELPTKVQSRMTGLEPEAMNMAPPEPAPVAVLPRNRQLRTVGAEFPKTSMPPARWAELPMTWQRLKEGLQLV